VARIYLTKRKTHASIAPFLRDIESLLLLNMSNEQAFVLALKSHETMRKAVGDELEPDATLAVLLDNAATRGKLPELAEAAREVESGVASGISPVMSLRAAILSLG
jgi:hypothetical protein